MRPDQPTSRLRGQPPAAAEDRAERCPMVGNQIERWAVWAAQRVTRDVSESPLLRPHELWAGGGPH